jgi:Bacterial Ig-like domain/Ig-like domain CHU_C associated
MRDQCSQIIAFQLVTNQIVLRSKIISHLIVMLSKWGLTSLNLNYFCRLKNNTLMRIIYSFLLVLVTMFTYAQTNVSWDFTAATPTVGIPVSNCTVSAVSQGNNNGTTTLLTTTSASSGYAGASGTSNAGAAAIVGVLNTGASGSAYFEFTLTPASGYTVNLSALNFGTRATTTGPQAYSVKTSFNSFGADVATGTIANNSTWSLKSNATSVTSASGTPLVVRIYAYGGAGAPSAGTANWRIDDLFLTVTVASSGADITPPLATTFTPSDDALNVSPSTNLTILFNEAIQKGTGNITIKKLSDNSTVQVVDVTTAAVTAVGSTVTTTINSLQLGTAYYVEIDATAIKDIANNNYAGITGTTTWNFTTSSDIFNVNFNTCTTALSDGFTQFSVTGPQVWACTTFGRGATPTASAPNGVQINGFASGSNIINEDWLISPSLNLVATTYPLLSFYSRTAFNGAPLKLKVSTNYTGTGNPALATWTDLSGSFPALASDVWTLSQNINLVAYKTANTYIAFVYNSTADDGARWTLDDIKIDNSLTPPPAALDATPDIVNFGFVASGNTLVKTVTFIASDITGDVTLNSPAVFSISKTNSNFGTSLTYTQAEANNIPKTVYIKFAPLTVNSTISAQLAISNPSVATVNVDLIGNTIDSASTLDVVNWNIEWFGSSTLGPSNKNLQEQNVKTVLQNVGADVYALEEVVSETRLANIVSQMPGYSYVISNYGSYTNPNQSGASPLADAQKLALVYKTALFPGGVTTKALLSAGINTAADLTNPAYNWYATGRFPFMVTGTTTLNGVTKTLRFIIVHAKANTSPTLTSYNRRKAGNDSLRTHLNTFYPNDNIIFLGDFNDDLDSTITAGINPKFSSYKQFVDDAANFYSPTLSLSLAGKKSTVSYNDVIDHVMLSNEMKCSYMQGTATVLTDVASTIPNYGNTTTDHYPVYTRYLFQAINSATISYPASPYCQNVGNVNISFTGTTGGVYYSSAGLSLNSTTGAVNTITSTPGTYTVTYELAASSACNPIYTTTTTITISAAATAATIAYTGSPYCSNAGTASVTANGATGGTYTSTAGLIINASTGAVTLATSIAGTYTVTYTVAAGGCGTTITTAPITISAAPTATISYTGSPYCSNVATATVTRTGTVGGTYSSTAGLSLNTTTGDVNIATSTAGTYTVTYSVVAAGGCAMFMTTGTITITAAPAATITYGAAPYCSNSGTANVIRTGTATGTYSSTAGLSINSASGVVTLGTSTAGTYTVTYTVAAAGGCALFTTTAPITITAAPAATITYAGSPYCGNTATATITRTGTTGGTYSSTTGLTLNTTTGDLNIATSTAGTYTVTYTVAAAGGCALYTTTTNITITAAPSATITYGAAPYCNNSGTATVTRTGTTTGVYSSTAGLSINPTTGVVTLGTSTAGTYTVTYTVAAAGGCAIFTTTTPITITAASTAAINYAGSPYCQAATIATVNRTGNTGGVYSSTTGLVINATTGDIDVAASTAGTYVVTYTLAANAGCAIFTTTANFVINALSIVPTTAIASSNLICATSGTVNLSITGGTLGAGASYKWYTGSCGGTLIGTGATLSNVFLNTTTTYFVRAEGTCNTTTCATVTVNVAVQPGIVVSTTPTEFTTPSQPVVLNTNLSPLGVYTYQWFKYGTAIAGATASTYTVSADQANAYTVTATATSGCKVTSPSILVIAKASSEIFISPNPNKGIFNVSVYDGTGLIPSKIRTINIYDGKGARVYSKSYPNPLPYTPMKVDISSLAKAHYYIVVQDENGNEIAKGTVQIL